ncbi:hypothetical protein SDC9_100755 [bioreactor metagenome]|uniref:Uncharacterized protein n=1 Tax=bioreactor metagenome TaxID=1076179 RepID=A0A645ASY5_9ZZZZ
MGIINNNNPKNDGIKNLNNLELLDGVAVEIFFSIIVILQIINFLRLIMINFLPVNLIVLSI